MYINASDALSFAALKQDFGLPDTGSELAEVFGPYIQSEAGGYWSYDPGTGFWQQHGERYSYELPLDGLAEADKEPYRRCTEFLSELAPPDMPGDRSTVQRDKPFLYMGFKFQWLFIPDLGRWELLPLGRHEPTADRS